MLRRFALTVATAVPVGASEMAWPSVLSLLAGVAASLVLSAPSIAGIGGGRSVGISRPISYSPARPSNSGAAAKPRSASRSSSAAPTAGTGTARASAPVASAAQTSARHESSSGSFWTPFVLGYMIAPSASHAAPSTPKPASPPTAGSPVPVQSAGADPASPAADPKARTGPFAIDIPESELFDGDCNIRPAAQEFINGAKIEHSVLFLSAPENGRCGKLRDRLIGKVTPAILVKSENDHIVLSRMTKQ